MRKRILALVLTAAIMATMIVMPASAVEFTDRENVTEATGACPCGCGKTLEKVTWKAYKGDTSTGHYYLEDDYVQDGEKLVVAGEKVVLDLRGHTITTAGKSKLFLVNGYLAVMDTVGGGVMSARCNGSDPGGVILVQENEIPDGAVFELYSGTLTPDKNAVLAYYGGLVCAAKGATFRMYDGLLLNGDSKSYGGNVCGWETSSKLEILGGSIIGGRSVAAWSGGGNIYARGPLTLKNCKVIGGYSDGGGGNIMKTGNTLDIENAVIADGIAEGTSTKSQGIGGNLYIQSSVTLNMKNSVVRNGYALVYGGNIYFGSGTHKKNITNSQIFGGTTDGKGANLYNSGSAVTTLTDSTISGGVDYKTGTLTLKGSSSIGLEAGKCPCCTAADWKEFGSAEGNHWKLSADNAAFAGLTVAEGQTLVIDLAGFDLTAAERAFTVEAGGKLILLDSVGGGVVTGSGVNGEVGGVIKNEGTLQIYGGKYVYAAKSGVTVAGGGVVSNAETFNLYGGILDGSAYKNTTDTGFGGAVYQTDATAAAMHYFTMSGGLIYGGSAYRGGSLYIGNYGDVTITGGMIRDGKAFWEGGNIYGYGGPYNSNYKFRITDCAILDGATVNDGSIEGWGGNINIGRYELTLNNCYVRGGSVSKTDGEKGSYGGNIHAGSAGMLRATNTIFDGGSSDTAGGNIYMSNTKSDVRLTNCLVLGGTAGRGGNIVNNNGKLVIQGGEVSYGTATTGNGGNIYAVSNMTLEADAAGNAPRIYGGSSVAYGGNMYLKYTVNIDAAHVAKGTAVTQGGDIFVANHDDTAVTFGTNVRGDIALGVEKAMFASADIYGGAINKITCTAENATFYLDGKYNNCGTIIKNDTLYLTVAAVVTADGTMDWFISNEEAVAACAEGQYLKLFTNNDLTLTKDMFVDLNGHTVNVSGDYKFYGMDASGDAYNEPAGSATGVTAQTYDVTDGPNGKRYIAVVSDGTATYHRLGMQITGVNIRPSAAGMYYTAKWSCDDTLKGLVSTYGIVTSLDDMPDENFTSDDTNRWTVFAKDTFQSGVSQQGVLIANVLREGNGAENNDKEAKMPVYAKAYLTFEGGPTLVGTENMRFSLYQLMKALDKLIMEKPVQYRKYNLSARNFYEKWKAEGMGSWELDKIPMPEDDGVINVLMIGNSFCYYYVEEMYGLAKAAGLDMRVCNVYYSGCTMTMHYNWWINGEANYQFFETYDNGRVGSSNKTLEWCLAQYDWDFISTHEYGIHKTGTVEQHWEAIKTYRDTLLPYLKEQFPNATVCWQQTWGYQPGYKRSDYDLTGDNALEIQAKIAQEQRWLSQQMCATYDLQLIPSGEAWAIVRSEYGYDNLCERMNINGGLGDYYHEGDTGGGQYLNACVWFEVLTGLSCIGNTYVPDYTLNSDITYAELQQAAHAAVEMMKQAELTQ